jgi:hypothetical protein
MVGLAVASRGAAVERPTLASTGPRGSVPSNTVYRKVADGDWRGPGGERAPFNFAVNSRDLVVLPGDKLVFKRITFDGHVDVGPVWNYYNDNTNETEVLFEDCIFNGGLGVGTVGRMRVTILHTAIHGYAGFMPSPDSLITVKGCSMVASHGGDAARIGRPKNQDRYPYGVDSRTPVDMRDCLIRTTGPSNPGDHRDAMQVLGGSGIIFSNVVFDLNSGEYKGVGDGQNASLFIEDGTMGSVSDIDVIDCWILGSGSYFHMAIQHRAGSISRNINLIRPRISRGTTPLYPTDFPAFQSGLYKVEAPVYSEDLSPMPLSAFGLTAGQAP